LQEFTDEGAWHDHALVDVEWQAAHVDLVDEVGGGFAGGDAATDQVKNFPGLDPHNARGGEALELVGVKVQRLADQERGLAEGRGSVVPCARASFASLKRLTA